MLYLAFHVASDSVACEALACTFLAGFWVQKLADVDPARRSKHVACRDPAPCVPSFWLAGFLASGYKLPRHLSSIGSSPEQAARRSVRSVRGPYLPGRSRFCISLGECLLHVRCCVYARSYMSQISSKCTDPTFGSTFGGSSIIWQGVAFLQEVWLCNPQQRM